MRSVVPWFHSLFLHLFRLIGFVGFALIGRSENVVQASAGNLYSHFIKADGTLWAMGYNSTGQFGDGTLISRSSPVMITSGVAAVKDAYDHTAFIKSDKTLWTVGTNSEGALGDGTRTDRAVPVQIATDVTAVSCGQGLTAFLKTNGTLWAMGMNFFGELGDGTVSRRLSPVQVATGVDSVSVGVFTTVFLKTDGTLWGAGRNHFGQLGDGTTTQRPNPVRIATNVKAVSTSGIHTMFIKADGTLWAVGHNLFGQLGDGTTTDRAIPVQVATGVTSVTAGFFHTLFVRTDGSLWAMGSNGGRLGDGAISPRSSPVRVCLTGSVRSLAAGYTHSLVVKQDGSLWGMGSQNLYGELGPTQMPQPYPVPTVAAQIVPAPSVGSVTILPSGSIGELAGKQLNEVSLAVDAQLVVQSQPASMVAVNVVLGDGTLSGGREELRFNPVPVFTGDIIGNFDESSRTLLLQSGTGAATLLQWQNALRAVTYAYTPQILLNGGREIIFAAHNGVSGNEPARKLIYVSWVAAQPANVAPAVGSSTTLSAKIAVDGAMRWQRNGIDVPGATAGSHTLTNLQPELTGLYTLVSSGIATNAAIVGLTTDGQIVGSGQQVGSNVLHPNGHRFDQVLLTGAAESITADFATNRITRTSYVDLNDDIVQIEFSGPGTLSLVLDAASGPATPKLYNQPNVSYWKGHAGIVITGADERTNVSVFTVGRATAFDPTGRFNFLEAVSASNQPANNGNSLFEGHPGSVYDGIADLAFIAISSPTGRFGGVRAANANFFASSGFTGIYAPGIEFTGPVYVGDITAFNTAQPMLKLGFANDVRITGGDLLQNNNAAVEVAGITQLRFTTGGDSHGNVIGAKTNQGNLIQNGRHVTDEIVMNP